MRDALAARQVQAVLVPSSDPHLSEYLPERWQGRAWLSGFTGSSGTLLVANDKAALFTDSRYWEQAEAELAGTGVDLVKLDGPATPAYVQWLSALGLDSTAGPLAMAVDGQVMGLAQTQALQDALKAEGWQLRTDLDMLDAVWPGRPGLPDAAVFEHLPPHAATSRADKLALLRKALADKGATHHWIATLDDLAWALNLRGADAVSYTHLTLPTICSV